jgi:hypothetical protein
VNRESLVSHGSEVMKTNSQISNYLLQLTGYNVRHNPTKTVQKKPSEI